MSIHKPVLLRETIELLKLKEESIVVDATLGGGGHAREILKKIGNGRLIAIDADKKAIENFRKENPDEERIILVNDNFSNLDKVLEGLKIEKVDAIMADLGWSSDQLVGKGMSFMQEEPLDMRFLRNTKLTKYEKENASAKDIVNNYSEEDLGRVIREYGEEKFWKRIARKIFEYRQEKNIETTTELAEIITSSVPEKYRHGKLNPATRTFQALRIETNQELQNLEKFLGETIVSLAPKGRLAIISFHSLEDRIVKNIFRENARGCICPPATQLQILQEKYIKAVENNSPDAEILEKALQTGPPTLPQCVCGRSEIVKIITKKPVAASFEETAQNPRARSAKLRVCEKI